MDCREIGNLFNPRFVSVANPHGVDGTNHPLNRNLQGDGTGAHAWFGGPGCAGSGKKHEGEARGFLCHPDLRIVGLCKKKASPQSSVLEPSPAAPQVPARNRAESEGANET